MSCSLFGKLPAKRDFIAVNMPRDLMRFWEVWLQGSMAASIQALGPSWKDAFLSAPIWRFWLGREHVGSEVMGAFMPSLDGVGRYFPLAVMVVAPEGQAFAAPTENDQGAWFDAAEAFLLDTLEPDANYELTLGALEGLTMPETIARKAETAVAPNNGLVGVSDDTGSVDVPSLLQRLEESDRLARQSSGSYWWSIGGETFPALALRAAKLPEAQDFALMLTGPARTTTEQTTTEDSESEQRASIGAEP